MRQAGLTVVTKILPERIDALPEILQAAESTDSFRFMKHVHYAAFVILRAIDGIGPRLVMETNYDGELAEHLDELINQGAGLIDRIYANCEDYPLDAAHREPQSVKDYFRDHSVTSNAYYVALPGRSCKDICNAIAVYQAAETYVRGNRELQNLSADAVWARLVEYFRTNKPRPICSPVSERSLRWRSLFNLFMLIVPSVLLLPVLPILLLITHIYERCETHISVSHEISPRMYSNMNLGTHQNHMCTLATVKPSRFRGFMMRLGLFITNVLAERVFIRGHLDALTTIHFARWSLIDDNRHVLFLTNFDGSWSNYIDDFSDPPHLNVVWSNTEGFPRTYFLLWRGARLIQQFQAHVVQEFQPTYFFHRPYGDHSVENLQRCLRLRDALARAIR